MKKGIKVLPALKAEAEDVIDLVARGLPGVKQERKTEARIRFYAQDFAKKCRALYLERAATELRKAN